MADPVPSVPRLVSEFITEMANSAGPRSLADFASPRVVWVPNEGPGLLVLDIAAPGARAAIEALAGKKALVYPQNGISVTSAEVPHLHHLNARVVSGRSRPHTDGLLIALPPDEFDTAIRRRSVVEMHTLDCGIAPGFTGALQQLGVDVLSQTPTPRPPGG